MLKFINVVRNGIGPFYDGFYDTIEFDPKSKMTTLNNTIFGYVRAPNIFIPKSVRVIQSSTFQGSRYITNITFAEDSELEFVDT